MTYAIRERVGICKPHVVADNFIDAAAALAWLNARHKTIYAEEDVDHPDHWDVFASGRVLTVEPV